MFDFTLLIDRVLVFLDQELVALVFVDLAVSIVDSILRFGLLFCGNKHFWSAPTGKNENKMRNEFCSPFYKLFFENHLKFDESDLQRWEVLRAYTLAIFHTSYFHRGF